MTDRVDRYRGLPVPFVLYGLPGWADGRWLEFWQVTSNLTRVGQVWLGHESGPASVIVGTFDPSDRPADSIDLAEELAIKLVNIGLPSPAVPRTDGLLVRLIDHAEDIAARRDEWPTMPVTLDGRAARLRYHEFAGFWAGTVDGHPIGAYGNGHPPDTLTLTPIPDTTPYGFDVTAGLRLADLTAHEPWHEPVDWHPDHRPLLQADGFP